MYFILCWAHCLILSDTFAIQMNVEKTGNRNKTMRLWNWGILCLTAEWQLKENPQSSGFWPAEYSWDCTEAFSNLISPENEVLENDSQRSLKPHSHWSLTGTLWAYFTLLVHLYHFYWTQGNVFKRNMSYGQAYSLKSGWFTYF